MSNSFIHGFLKEARIGAMAAAGLRKTLKPAAYVAGGGGVAAGGYAVGKGKGAEEQLGKDEEWFRGYLDFDKQRDFTNMRRAARQGAAIGYRQVMIHGRGASTKMGKKK